MQKTDFNVLELFCILSYVRAAMHRITGLVLLVTLIAGWAKKLINRFQAHICWKSSFSVSEAWLMRVREGCLFFMKLKVICNAEDRF